MVCVVLYPRNWTGLISQLPYVHVALSVSCAPPFLVTVRGREKTLLDRDSCERVESNS